MRGFFCQYSRAMPPSPIQAEKLRPVAATLPPLRTARQRYQEGAIDFLNVITTQAQVLQSENDLADSDTQIATFLVNLYRALGGGWQIVDVVYGADDTPRQKIGAR